MPLDTLVVNKHHYRRTLGMLPSDVYIGRPGPWGNPYIIGVHGNREEVITMFHEWLLNSKVPQAEWMRTHIHELKGKTLICWCKPDACHGDILAKLAEETA